MAFQSMLLSQDVNKLYPDILNHEISAPPQWKGRVSHSFFLKRRPGLNTQVNFWGNDVIDYLQYEWFEYWLVKSWSNIKLYKWASVLYTGTYNSAVNHKLFTTGWPSGVMQDSGTSLTATANLGTYTLTDSSKSWVVNAYAAKYIYIVTAGTGTWQVFRIISNTATVLTLESWWTIAPAWVTSYKIFDNYSETVAFVWGDGIYTVNNDTNINKMNNFGTVIDCTYSLWRNFIVDTNNNVWVSDEWRWCYFSAVPIWTYSWVLSIASFQDFVLLMCKDRIGMIKKVSYTIDTDGSVLETFKTLTVSTNIWVFSAKSFAVYNQWLYIFSAINKLVALSITAAGTDRFTVTQTDQWIFIQQFLDNVKSTDVVSLWINAEKICLTIKNSDESLIFFYDTYYNFWYRWSTQLNITGVAIYNNIFFIGSWVFKIDKSLSKDTWALDYTPELRSIIGEENIFSLKNYRMHKLYIWADTDDMTKIKYICHLDWSKYSVETDFKNIKYLQDSTLFTDSNWFGSSMFGYWIFGWEWFSMSEFIMWYVNTIEFPITLTSSLTEIYITWDIEFGWMMFEYEELSPTITPLNSVAWFTI